ncbi:TonB-dependent receptor domain-containing protein [Sphingomonas sp.]|uniref:TonB-dependent receptor domain-containing protein n=1 Tax=Sphingomonas sp. TaxID=28214 RepID=UPI002C3130A4|nr:TonB-dependent receptor [Sphingomonas sp.]HWK34848.1 TonB-dependent receptor [Sphingomonas sp.]
MLKAVLLCGVASVILPSMAQARAAASPPSPTPDSAMVGQAAPDQDSPATQATPDRDIVVTGSRITANGFQQPTPVTVVGEAEIARQAPATIASYLNQLPSFGNATSAKNPAINVAGGGAEFVNLRNLGATRTLVLLDNRRVVESTTAGGVDTVTLPFGLIKRVEVVTGGASAAWGSDAVAGVVNFVLDRDYQGLGVNVESGVTERGDAGYVKANLTAGHSFAGGKGHIVAEFDYFNQPDGVDLIDRSFFKSRAVVNNPAYTATNGQPRQITVRNVGTSNVSPGGVITSGPLRGIQFLGPSGTPAPYDFGNQSGLVQYGGDYDNTVGLARSMSTPLNYANFFGHVDYEVVPGITAYVEGFYGRSNYNENGYLYYMRQGNITINADNAYLNPAIRDQLLAAGQTTFSLGKDTVDFGPPTSSNSRDVWRAVAGFDGEIGSSWKWHAYYTHGESTTNLYAYNNTIIANFNNAVDAVRDPASGAIVCRSTLTNPANGCVPLNLFGVGVATPEAIAYTHGTAFQRMIVKLDVASVDASGTIFSLPAGDVSVAFGGDYIRNEASATQDALALARAFAVQNFQPFYGKRNIKEGFVEAVIPILKDVPLAQKLELNAAGRLTDYSTSGSVKTWKIGISDQVFDDLRVRGTLSRDIRAPTLTDLFSGGTLTQQPVFDSLTNKTYPQYTNATGNPALNPELADTTTAGVVYSPGFIPGLQLSVDYYRISLKGAIASISAAQELAFCNAGQTQYCQYIHRDANQAILSIDTVPVNVASLVTQGWDFEVDYRRRVGAGQVSLRGLASYVPVFRQVDAVGNVTDLAGQVADLNPGQPKLKANAFATYEQGPFSLTLNARYVGPAKLQNNWVSGVDVDDNSVKSFLTFGLTGIVKLDGPGAYTLTVGIDNLFDRDPIDLPVVPATVQYSAPGLGGRFDLYDPIGRSFRVGVRAKF